MRNALHDLGLEQLTVFYPGTRPYQASERIRVLPATAIAGGDPRSLLRGRVPSSLRAR